MSHRKSLIGKHVLYAADVEERGGGSILEALLRAGASVVAVSRSELLLGHLSQRVGRSLGTRGLTTFVADLADGDGGARVAAAATAQGQTLHAVVANLGCHQGPAAQDASSGEWDALSRGLKAHLILAKALIPVLRGVPDSLYLLLNDGAAFAPRPASGITAAAAAGELMLARSLALETGGNPIVHSLVVTAAGNASAGDNDWLTPQNVGEAVVTLLERPRVGYGQVILNAGWRQHLALAAGGDCGSYL
jgi:NADP-dependent 3-hydroxy acid dehydrogenase YdfG